MQFSQFKWPLFISPRLWLEKINDIRQRLNALKKYPAWLLIIPVAILIILISTKSEKIRIPHTASGIGEETAPR